QTNANRLRITTLDGGPVATVYPQAVTPTMLVFRMPVDCFAPLVLQVSKRAQDGSRSAATIPLCDPDGCVRRPAGAPCDDGNACTLGEQCSGTGDVCSAAGTLTCRGQCLTGTCDPARGCVPRPFPAPCDDGDACTEDDHCRGDADVCVSGPQADCNLGDPCMVDSCEPAAGCHHDARIGFDAVACVCRRPPSPACAGDRVPKSFARRLARACELIQRAEGPARPGATKRLLLASTRALARAAE